MILTTPYQLDLWPYSDALGFAIVQMANRDLAFDDGDVKWLLVVVLIVSIALLAGTPLRRASRRGIALAIGAVAAFLVARLEPGRRDLGVERHEHVLTER